jgi:T4 RnlA family RNA ligase
LGTEGDRAAMTLKVQEFLRSYGQDHEKALKELDEKYHISHKRHTGWHRDHLVLLKYSQIDSPMSERIVQECRGLILDSSRYGDWNVVGFPFTKFFNYGESNAAPIDWSTAVVQEKLDGSMITLYCDNSNWGWHVATSGCPDGSNQVGDFEKTFKELFYECFKSKKNYRLDENLTYIFELTSPLNRVVCDYKESKVTLIGVRNNKTFEELPVSQFEEFLYVVKSYPLTSLEECIEACSKLNPLQNEGFVVVDKNFSRVKIKSPAYVALHHLKDSCSISKMCEVVRAGEHEEFKAALDSYPDLKVKFLEMVAKYEDVVRWSNLTYTVIGHIKNQKEFALEANKSEWPGILFMMRKNNCSPQAVLKNMSTNTYLRLMGVK